MNARAIGLRRFGFAVKTNTLQATQPPVDAAAAIVNGNRCPPVQQEANNNNNNNNKPTHKPSRLFNAVLAQQLALRVCADQATEADYLRLVGMFRSFAYSLARSMVVRRKLRGLSAKELADRLLESEFPHAMARYRTKAGGAGGRVLYFPRFITMKLKYEALRIVDDYMNDCRAGHVTRPLRQIRGADGGSYDAANGEDDYGIGAQGRPRAGARGDRIIHKF